MKENTNKTIAVNSAILYIRLLIVSVSGLLYTRFSLQALGTNDYGIYSVVACIITFATMINTIMIVTSNRYMAMAIGKGNINESRKTFNTNLIIHIGIAILTIMIALPIGHLYITNYINYDGNISNVYYVFYISIIASALSFIGVPYNGLLLAKEKFIVFCSTDVFASIVKLIFTYLLIDHFQHKLIIYALIMAFMTSFPTLIYCGYCKRKFPAITHFLLVKDRSRYWEVIKFSTSIAYGAFALIAQTQGSSLLINIFFNTAMNAGLAVATSVSNILQTFANNAQKSISPQVVKSYASNNISRSIRLVCFSSKLTFCSMLYISMPFLLIPETIYGLWLQQIPPYAISFTRLLIINLLIMSINAGLSDFVFATGRIKAYQIITNTLIILSVIVGYFSLKCGLSPEYLFYIYIGFSTIVSAIRPIIIKHISSFNIKALAIESYIPAIAISILSLALWPLRLLINQWALIVISYIYLSLLIYLIALKKDDRNKILSIIKSKFTKK
uniref:lipopolysaccharide biosynthesis protein n=1 Tax=Prevotella sp. TaxID=59823 RepID=UPI00402A0A16